jgi:hypothetical protein
MFFHISTQSQQNYPCQWQLGNFSISTDPGWKNLTIGPVQILYKGYADSGPMESLLGQIMFQSDPHITGNFCALVVVHDTLTIQTDRYRSFPIYIDSTGINNLVATDRTAWTDSLITVHADLSVTENKFDVIGNIDTTELDFHQALDQVHDILTRKTQEFLSHNTLPLKVFLSGGVDTMLVYSYLKAAAAEFETVDYEHLEHDYFWRANSDKIVNHWGYQQTHHWRESCVLASGTPGDEFTLRSPNTANLYLQYHNTSIPELSKLDRPYLHRAYFDLPKNQKLFDQQTPPTGSLSQLHHDLCNTVVNDWQHWHLGNTLHWTPLRDLEIFKIIMRLPLTDAKNQIMDSMFSQTLIERNMPGAAEFISDQKNVGPELKNLNRLFC